MLTIEATKCPEREPWRSIQPIWQTDEWQAPHALPGLSQRRQPGKATGGLVGHVVDPAGQSLPARIVLRDERRIVLRECFPSSPLPGHPGGRFELGGVSPGNYVVEIAAPGHCSEIRPGIAVDAGCDTHLGTIRLTPTETPGLTVPTGDEEQAHGS